MNMLQSFKTLLEYQRKERNFQTKDYIFRKIDAINNFFDVNKLDSAVIGISGGIDSAVALKLLIEASKLSTSPIKHILPLIVPINCAGTTRQSDATALAEKFLKSQYINYQIVDISKSLGDIVSVSEPTNAWAIGQLASCLRVPVFYYHAAILQTKGYHSIVVGTTNRDEGSYIGFFGKASDGMVDLQPIADIHKSEVYKIAKYYGIIQEIIDAVPSGDVWDGKKDHDMIGATYDQIEAFLLLKEVMPDFDYKTIKFDNIDDTKDFHKACENIEAIHSKNAHKYMVGSPAHFIDVMERKIHGGW